MQEPAKMKMTVAPHIVIAVVCSITVGLWAQEAPPELDPDDKRIVPPLWVAPIESVTQFWHHAPGEIVVPVGTEVVFVQPVRSRSNIEWDGADKVTTEDSRSSAALIMDAPGARRLAVTVTSHSTGDEFQHTCDVRAVASSPPSRTAIKEVWVREFNLPPDASNEQTMDFFFADSIATLHKTSNGYLTSTGRELHLEASVDSAEYTPMVEWIVDGHPIRPLPGTTYSVTLETPGPHSITSQIASADDHVNVFTYGVEFVEPHADAYLPDGEWVRFVARTEPRGFESLVTWLSSTKFGSAMPVRGYGPVFFARFDNTWGEGDDERSHVQWLGVKGDGMVHNQDFKAEYPVFEIRFRTFIACNAIDTPACIPWLEDLYKGDDRTFAYDTGTHRTQQHVEITIDPRNKTGIVVAPVQDVGETRGYDASDGTNSGADDCPWSINNGAVSECTMTAAITDETLKTTVTRIDNEEVKVSFLVHIANPCAPGSPEIDARIDVFIRQRKTNGGLAAPAYRIVGAHDGFPWYEIYIDDDGTSTNASRRYGHDANAEDQGPCSLFGDGEFDVDTGYVIF